ncbi:MAG TPA: hypothetical protein VKQ52_15790, partial [Puia sp.]|nr:hypothetical protein [Puia sp.]
FVDAMPARISQIHLLLLFVLLLTGFRIAEPSKAISSPAPEISIITDEAPGPIALHGLERLTSLMTSRHIAFETISDPARARGKYLLVAGLSDGNGAAAQWLKAAGQGPARTAEAYILWHTIRQQKPALVISGYDDTGLMYALQETARQIGLGVNAPMALDAMKDANEKPSIHTRAVSIYTMNRAYWESRFYDEKYWTRYLDELAENRFNSLVVVFGYENGGFLAPCYPYFFNVDGYPGIRMTGLSEAEQRRNLTAINRLIAMAHQRGIRFTAGIWDHIYRGGVQGGGIPGNEKPPDHPVPGLVWGVTADNLTAYTKAALTAFIRQIPVDALQFRMHGESGLKKEEEESFWADVFRMIRQVKPDLQIEMRAKELPPTVIRSAISTGIRFRIATKFWMEQFGLPYHPTRINPEKSYIRHSYGDLLRYPKEYNMDWRLWNGGTNRVLLWGDPDYVRRFMKSVHLYDGDGFEINEPLATKMEAQPHDAAPFELLQPQHRYYEYEFERYWHLFQVFGLIGYNPNTSSESWDKDFEARFGKTTGPLIERALHRASGILPRIIASCYPYSYFPMTRGWAEKQRLGDLPTYAKAEGSDLCQFADFDDEAGLLLTGGETARIRPAENSQWFEQAARDVQTLINQVKDKGDTQNKELGSTLADLGILSNLALYHARRAPAAVYYCLYQRTHDVSALDSAIAHERNAIDAWRQIVVSAADYYNDNLRMGVSVADLCGHWKDELGKLEDGLQKLEQQRQHADPGAMTVKAPAYKVSPAQPFDALFRVELLTPGEAMVNQSVNIRLRAAAPLGIKWIRLFYRAVNQQLEYKDLPMEPDTTPGEYKAVIPVADIDPGYDLMYYIALMDKGGHGRIFPDLNKETPYKIIKLIR